MRKQIIDIFEQSEAESRPYQIRLVESALKNHLEKGAKSVLVESPVGSGKTIIGLVILKFLESYEGYKFGWTAMRHHLLTQAKKENEEKKFKINLQFFTMFEKHPPIDIDSLLVDEAQHDPCSSMGAIHNRVKPKVIFGLSGTPFRTDRVKMCFESQVKDFGIHNLIKEGYLSKYHHFTISDWDIKTVTDTYLDSPERWGKSVIFFHRIEQCKQAESILKAGGIKCTTVTGQTNVEEQLNDFRAGKYDVVINCMMLTEGFDFPSLKTVFVRPSCKSATIQMGGRVFRKYPGYQCKQIVQNKLTPWPFLRTALAENMFIWEDGKWKCLTSKTEEVETAYQKGLMAIVTAHCEMPRFITKKKKEQARRRPNNRGRT